MLKNFKTKTEFNEFFAISMFAVFCLYFVVLYFSNGPYANVVTSITLFGVCLWLAFSYERLRRFEFFLIKNAEKFTTLEDAMETFILFEESKQHVRNNLDKEQLFREKKNKQQEEYKETIERLKI